MENGSCLTNTQGLGKRYYGGNEFIDETERLARSARRGVQAQG